MLDTLQERYEETKDRIGGLAGIDPPDGANAGISRTESMFAHWIGLGDHIYCETHVAGVLANGTRP